MNIIPSILVYTKEILLQQLDLSRSFAPLVQLDIVDDQLYTGAIPTLDPATMTAEMFEGLQLEVDSMSIDPQAIIHHAVRLGAIRVIVHWDSCSSDPESVLALMQYHKLKPAIALKPEHEVGEIGPYLSQLETVQLMTIQPGAQGRPFIPEVLHKVEQLRAHRPDLRITVDGGVNAQTIPLLQSHAIDAAAVGSSLWGVDDPVAAYTQLCSL